MSTLGAAKLAQYNKKSPYKRQTPIDTRADKSFGTWSYANMYDALYNKFSQNKNFNLDMWHQAFKLGEQDQYLALLEQNKDTQLSDQFYDSQYYDYETMMLEMYKPMASTTNIEERFHVVYDPVSGKPIEESLGEMSDQAYIQYQLDQMRISQQAEITRALEQERKDELGWWKQFGNDVLATMGEFGEGLLSGLAGMADFFVGIGYATGYSGAALLTGDKENQNWLDAFVDYFGEVGLTAAEKRTVRAALDEYERTHTHFKDIDGNMTNIGKYVAGISNSIGMMIPAIVTNAVTGGAAFVGTATFYTSIFSSNMYENATSVDRVNSPSGVKVLNATLKTGAEALIEYGLGKLLGGTIQNQMIGMGGRNLSQGFISGFGKTSGLKYFFKSAAQEGLEEFLQDFGTECIDQFTALQYEGYGNTGVTFQTLLDSFFIGALSSMLMSGGRVALNATTSAVRNKIAPGSGDILIETAEGPQKVTGFNRLQYSQILSDFQQAVDDLKNKKMSSKKNIELAQEVYGAISAISQFYSSFDQQRIKNCEMLLDRVVKAEKAQVKTEAQNFAETVESTFRSMVDEVGLRHVAKIKAAVEKGQDKLKEGGVTQTKEFIDTDGNSYKDPAIKDVEERLGKKAVDIIDKLREAYDFITITDGHVAYEDGKYLFVSEAWLQNYTISDIYKYLEQTRVLEALTTDKTLAPMVKKLVAFDKEFTKQENVTAESAMMDFLFNKSVYQAFLLSNAGKNAHEYKNFIFQLHEIIKDLANRSKYQQQLFKGKQSQRRINLLNQIYEQIKETMREPTITAILTWHFDPQTIGADSVLTPKDRELIAQYEQRRRVIANAGKEGKNSSAHENLARDIISKAEFNETQLALVNKHLDGTATAEEDLEAIALLDEADSYMTTYDFEVSSEYSHYYGSMTRLVLRAKEIDFTQNEAKEQFTELIEDTENLLSELQTLDLPDDIRVRITNWYKEVYDNLHEFDFNSDNPKMAAIFGPRIIRDYCEYLKQNMRVEHRRQIGLGAFTIPYQAAAMAMNEGDVASTQFVDDKLNEFRQAYGISARQMIMGDLTGMSMPQRNQLTQDMDVLKAYNLTQFVIKKLESMLGDKYIVTPTGKTGFSTTEDTFDFLITKSIPADKFIYQDVLDLDKTDRNKVFTEMFSTQDVRKLSDFIDVSAFPTIDLDAVNVYFNREGSSYAIVEQNKINVDPDASGNYFGTLVHEVNHILQGKYNMPNGFNPKAAAAMPDLLAYTVNHYRNYVAYVLSKHGYDIDTVLGEKTTVDTIRKLPEQFVEYISRCAYMLVQGESWARAYMHNGKMVHGFTESIMPSGTYLIAPDGDTLFEVRRTSDVTVGKNAPAKLSSELAGSALDVAIQKLFLLKWRQEQEGFKSTSRDTYHSYLTKNSSTKLLYSILSPSVGVIDRTFIKLSDVIKNPQQYLAPEILAKCNGDFSEGNVFYRIKEYVEANHEGVSIDINNRQEYIWVDDNAFDDLLLVSMQSKAESDEVSLVKQFKPHEEIPLSKFYSQAELNRLGIDPKAYALIDPTNGGTETIFDKEHRHGAIILDVDENITDRDFINDLNHEFRHLLQYYNGFATGFTGDFKITDEMRVDIKKHLPELFKNQEIITWAKKFAELRDVKNYEDIIVQRAIYYSTIGELNAYAFNASDLYAKPTFVNMEAGKPTIFMPWYDAKTGEGRYKTDFLAMRAEKTEKVLRRKGGEGIDLPIVEKKKDTRPRYFSKAKAKGTNLEYYTIDEIDQLDPRMQDFVIATTGHEDKLPKELWNSIRRGKLTIQNFYTWFQKAKNIDEFTFNIINKYIFKNDHITSMEQLDKVLSVEPAIYWAAAQVLRKKGLPLKELIAENDIVKFFDFLKSAEGSDWYDEILGYATEYFIKFQVDIDPLTGKPITEDFPVDDKVLEYMRPLAMHYFDGTLAGAFYLGNAFKQTIYWTEIETRLKTDSTDKSLGDGMSDDKDVSLIDAIAEEDAVLDEDSRAIGNDIMALYELDSSDAEMYIDRLVQVKYIQEIDRLVARLDLPDKAKTMLRQRLSDPDKLRKNYSTLAKKENLTDTEKKQLKNFKFELAKYKEIMESITSFKERLETLAPAEIVLRGTALVIAQMTNTSVDEKIFDVDTKYIKPFSEKTQKEIIQNTLDEAGQKELEQIKDSDLKMDRVNLQHRITASSNKLIKSLKEKAITFDELPDNVKDLFIVSVAADKTLDYKLDKEKAYYVGKGRKALPGKSDMGRAYYVQKHNLTEGNEAYRHDVSHLIEVDALLRATNEEIKKIVAERKLLKADAEKKVKQLEEKTARAERRVKKLEAEIKELKENAKKMRTTEIRIAPKKKKRTSDTPNVFNIVSAIDMPYQLRKILDTSFEEMANTEVQFASRDESGQLYDKEQFKRGEFESRIKHEVSNWDTFYEANRNALLSLTRNDVLDIIEFFQRGATTIDGPANKLAAFEIFMLGYIVDGTRRNFSDWNFSDKEIEIIEKLYEQKASVHGSGLNAVKQMLSVVDPLKKVRQRMFDDWEAISDDDKDRLIEAVDALQNEKDPKVQVKKGEDVMQMLEEFGKRQLEADKIKYPRWSKAWWSRLWNKTKSYRYMAMLSSPTTWIRNSISNVLVLGFNKTSDVLGKLIFGTIGKKGYRKEQWNLSGTKISTESKNFIDTYILSNPIFSPLYDMSSKYDIRQNKKIADERGLLVNLIAKAYEKQYAQNRRFDSKVMNGITKFVDNRISDKRFVKFAAGRYFGKMLTIEVERGNIDLSKGLSSDVLNLFADAVILANQEYMHKRSFGADLFDGIRDKHPNMYEALTFWQPFINSSLNWFAESFKYTPFGLAGSIVRACKLEQQITRLNERREAGEMVVDSRTAEFLVRRDIGKGVLGLLLSSFGIWLALAGRIRIDEDDEKFYAYIDEQIKLDITNLFGSSSLLAGASIAQLWIKQSDGDVTSLEDTFTLLTDTMLEGFFAVDILERHKWGGTWDDLLTETESVMRSFVPQMWQTIIACTNQENIRYSSGFKGMWERWLNTFVPTQPFGNRKINPYTGELEDKYSLPIIGGLLQKGILGPKVYWVEVSETERMCRELDVNKGELTGELTVDGKKYELDRLVLNTKYGELNKESLAKIKSQRHYVEMPDGTFKTLPWDKMSDEQRANVLSRTMTHNGSIAKIYMWTQMGHKYYASDSMWAELRKLGITQNVYEGDKGFVE